MLTRYVILPVTFLESGGPSDRRSLTPGRAKCRRGAPVSVSDPGFWSRVKRWRAKVDLFGMDRDAQQINGRGRLHVRQVNRLE
jgi:hypothetical protein